MRADRAYRALPLAAWVTALTAGLAAPLTSHGAAASWKPEQNVEIVIPTSPGTGSDTTGRSVQQLLREKKLVEAPVTVVNKPGGGGTIGHVYLNQHPGNGHYFMLTSPILLTSHITGRTPLKYTDTTPLAQLGTESVVFTVRADSSLKTGKDLADRLKTDPGGVSFAIGASVGSQNHIAAAQMARGAGAEVRRLKVVAFGGSTEGVTALLGGHIDVVVSSASSVLQHVKAGKARILAVAAEQRVSGALSSVPTWKELGISAVSANWRSVVGPKGMTEDQVGYWDEVFARLVQLPEWKQDLERKLIENTYLNAQDTRKLMDAQHTELSTVLSELGLAK